MASKIEKTNTLDMNPNQATLKSMHEDDSLIQVNNSIVNNNQSG